MVSIERELHKLERLQSSYGPKDDRTHSRNRHQVKAKTKSHKKK